MKMKFDIWKKRVAERNDITMHLVHLTKDAKIDDIKYNALDILFKILKEKQINGSTTESGFICGNTKAVCFQEAPLYSLAQNIYYEQKYRAENPNTKVKYLGFGLLFKKVYVFKKYGRPVVYDRTADAKKYLPESEWWRIVNLDLSKEDNIIDWSHEREWRVPCNFKFSLSEASVIVPNAKAYKKFMERCNNSEEENILKKIRSIINLGDLFY